MSWLELKLRSTSADTEALENLLLELGAVSVTLTDAEDQPLFEPLPGETPLWQQLVITALFDDSYLDETVTSKLLQALATGWQPRTLPPLQHGILADKDWVRAWLDDFKPMRFGERLWVCPSEMQAPGEIVLRLDPGLAFGTGTHPTTSLCLQWLDGHPPTGQQLLDYGCGSGILGIAALLLGAATVYGIDNDPQALIATADNCRKNALPESRFPVHLPQDFQQLIKRGAIQPADGIMANILAGTLIQLAELLASQVKSGGWILLSGILHEQTDDVITRYQEWFRDFAVAQQEDWVRITAIRQ